MSYLQASDTIQIWWNDNSINKFEWIGLGVLSQNLSQTFILGKVLFEENDNKKNYDEYISDYYYDYDYKEISSPTKDIVVDEEENGSAKR